MFRFFPALLLICSSWLVSCAAANQDQTGQASVAASGAAALPDNIELYSGNPLQTWQVSIKSPDQEEVLSGATVTLADGTGELSTSGKDAQNDALTFKYQGSWYSALSFKSDSVVLDLSRYAQEGSVSFDIQLDDIQGSALDLHVGSSKVRLREWGMAREGKGWQHVDIALSCFAHATDLARVAEPFTLQAGGKGQFQIANVQYRAKQRANFNCPDPASISVTPDTLHEYWSMDWWIPRHEEKVAQAKEGKAELLMIGDSITHNWETAGQEVWERHFSHINTLNLGFGGDRTENVLWRLQHGEIDKISPKLAVIMIGTNNTGHRFEKPEYIANGVAAIIDELQHTLPETQLVLLAIFPRSEFLQDDLRKNNLAANRLIKTIAVEKGVLFKDIGSIFLMADGTLTRDVMPDLLHPNARGYELWAEQLQPLFKKYLNK